MKKREKLSPSPFSEIISTLRTNRYLMLNNFPESLTLSLKKELESALEEKPEWMLIDQISNPELQHALFKSSPRFCVVDALHINDEDYLKRSVKQLLVTLPETHFLIIGNTKLASVSIPSYLGDGKNINWSGEKIADDSALLKHSRRIFPKYSLEDLILGPRAKRKLSEAIDYIRVKSFCENDWGFRKRHSRGHGVTLVLHGKSGTGKTMAAEVIANTLGLPLYQIDLSSIMSKWIGETEKNLKTVFQAAQGVKGILLFDEGDAIFGQRTEVKASQDRYANLEVNYLLQEIETFDGIAILSTNHEKSMDDAFLRRFTYAINFGAPTDSKDLEKIWRVNIPKEMPVSPDVDFAYLSQFPITGGKIKNIIREAAAIAASADRPSVSLFDFMWAMKREHQKHGHSMTREELGEDMWRKVGIEWEDQRPFEKTEMSGPTTVRRATPEGPR